MICRYVICKNEMAFIGDIQFQQLQFVKLKCMKVSIIIVETISMQIVGNWICKVRTVYFDDCSDIKESNGSMRGRKAGSEGEPTGGKGS